MYIHTYIYNLCLLMSSIFSLNYTYIYIYIYIYIIIYIYVLKEVAIRKYMFTSSFLIKKVSTG